MPSTPKKNLDRINEVLNAWQTLRPNKTFSGLTLEQFKAKLQPCFDARLSVESLNNQLIAAQNQRDDADLVALETITLVINAVRGDPDEGPDGELYEAMGFVRSSERKSGLTRGARRSAQPANASAK